MSRSIMLAADGVSVQLLDQRALPWQVLPVQLNTVEQIATAITQMWVRGAPLIGLAAAYGVCFAMRDNPSDAHLQHTYTQLLHTRPTAVNLRQCLDSMLAHLLPLPPQQRLAAAYAHAHALCNEDEALCRAIGQHGLPLIAAVAQAKNRVVHVLTHCNAGRLATTDYGTALAPIYLAHEQGIAVHVWVDETRPRVQGALTAYELAERGIAHTIIADNAGGLLMQRGEVDLCLVGADRVTQNGDVCNKVGTYLKALAAFDNNVPFYVAFPHTTFDGTMHSGAHIPIENRSADEVLTATGRTLQGDIATVSLFNGSTALNPAFDVTPARLITGYLTERGVLAAEALHNLFIS